MTYQKGFIKESLRNSVHFGAKIAYILGQNSVHFGASQLRKLLSASVLQSYFSPIIILIKDLIIFNYNKTEPKNCGIFGPVSLKNELHEASNKIAYILGQTLLRICLTTKSKYTL